MDRQKIIVIVGPTGVGKTSLSIELAKKLNGEIISGDSMQVYRNMDIGTAKIREDEKEGIPHYLLDVQAYDEPFNVKTFQEQCRRAIEAIRQNGHVPIICGGTGLYLKATLYDYEFEGEQLDEQYDAYLKTKSNEQLYALLRQIDPGSCGTIHPNNRKRVIRALHIAHSGATKSEREAVQKHEPLYDVFWIGLNTDRKKLNEQIDKRVDQMFEEGLTKEVERLFSDPQTWEYTSFQGIGYKEFKNYFLKIWSEEEVREKIKVHTRQYAKRQLTWFNHQMPVQWFDKKDTALIIRKAEEWYNA